MAKIKLYRQSGKIVDTAAQAAFDEDFRQMFDKVEARVDKIWNNNAHRLNKVPKMILMQRFLRSLERSLYKKHAVDTEIEFPKTLKQVNAIIEKYDGTPLCFAQKADRNGLVAILMDDLNN